jgi:hypothetical protein
VSLQVSVSLQTLIERHFAPELAARTRCDAFGVFGATLA